MATTFEDRINELRTKHINVFCDPITEKNKKFIFGQIHEMYEGRIREVKSPIPEYDERLTELSCLRFTRYMKGEEYYEAIESKELCVIPDPEGNFIYNFISLV